MVNDFIGQATFFLNIDKFSQEKKEKVIQIYDKTNKISAGEIKILFNFLNEDIFSKGTDNYLNDKEISNFDGHLFIRPIKANLFRNL